MSKMEKMRRELEHAIEQEAYERAAQLRDQIKALDARQQQRKVSQAKSQGQPVDSGDE